MALKISSNNIPYAFSHIMELSQLPTTSTYDVIFNNKTIEQAVDTTAAYTTGFGWEEEEEEDWWREEDILDDPDALDKAKYQAENPNAIMTPWGIAMDLEVVDAIIYDSPGVQELLGLTNEEIAEVTESADAIIDASGDNLDEILSQADATAMAENLDPNEVGTGILDEMMKIPSPETTVGDVEEQQDLRRVVGGVVKVSASPRIPEEWPAPGTTKTGESASSWQDYLYSGDATEGWEPDEYWTTEGDVVPSVPPVPDLLAEDIKFLDSLLDLTDSKILFYINEALNDNRLSASSLPIWIQGYLEWSDIASKKYNLRQDILALVSGEDYVADDIPPGTSEAEPQPTTKPVPESLDPGDEDASLGPGLNPWSTIMRSTFIEALNKQPHPRYESYTMGGLLTRKQKLDRYNEAYVVFFLDRESVEGWVETIAKEFATFLNKYWNDPEAHSEYMDKAKLIEKAQLLASYFDDPTGMQMGEQDVGDIYAAYAETIFGDIYVEGKTYNDSNREILLKLMRSGRGYGDHPANRYIASKMTSDRDWGKLWQESFREMVENMPQTAARQPAYDVDSGPDEYWEPDEYWTTEGDVVPTVSSLGPEYFGTGYPFGRPGVTLGMLRPEPASSWQDYLYSGDATEGWEPPELWTTEGGVVDPFGGGNILSDRTPLDETITNWGTTQYGELDPTMVLPNINPAALPVSNISDADWAAHWGAVPSGVPPSFIDPAVVAAITQHTPLKDQDRLPLVPYNAPAGISRSEHIDSMPDPLNEAEAEKLYKGLPYQTGRWTGGTQYQWSTMSATEKKRIMETNEWVEGTTFVPTKSWTPSGDLTYTKITGIV